MTKPCQMDGSKCARRCTEENEGYCRRRADQTKAVAEVRARPGMTTAGVAAICGLASRDVGALLKLSSGVEKRAGKWYPLDKLRDAGGACPDPDCADMGPLPHDHSEPQEAPGLVEQVRANVRAAGYDPDATDAPTPSPAKRRRRSAKGAEPPAQPPREQCQATREGERCILHAGHEGDHAAVRQTGKPRIWSTSPPRSEPAPPPPVPLGGAVISTQEWYSDQIWPGCRKKRIRLPAWIRGTVELAAPSHVARIRAGIRAGSDDQRPWLIRWRWTEQRRRKDGTLKEVQRDVTLYHFAHHLGTVFRALRPEDDAPPPPETLFPLDPEAAHAEAPAA